MSHPLFEIVTTTAGAISIRNKVVNEIMHNPIGPWVEANALYIEPSRLARRLIEGKGELVLFDVGLGAAANALAALACWRKTRELPQARPLRLVSFEKEMELLRFALEHAEHFEHFHGFETMLRSILERGEWKEDGLFWSLREGDFLDSIDREIERPELIFFDPYSPKVNREMWSMACFSKIRDRCRPPEEGGSLLMTYSQATGIRAALLCAGFHVGYGPSTGLKEETTQAATDRGLLESPLGREWLERWKRSHTRYPFDCLPEREAEVDRFILEEVPWH